MANYIVTVENEQRQARVIVPTLQIASGLITHNLPRGYHVSSSVTRANYTHRNSAQAQSAIDVGLMGLTSTEELRGRDSQGWLVS